MCFDQSTAGRGRNQGLISLQQNTPNAVPLYKLQNSANLFEVIRTCLIFKLL
jgi:hypothetical protein